MIFIGSDTISDLIRGNNPKESEPIRKQVFHLNQSELGLIQTDFSIRINPIFPTSDSCGLILIENLVWIHSDCCLGLNRIVSDRFFTIFRQSSYKTFFRMIRIGSDTDIGMNRNSSDWPGMNSYPILSPGKLNDLIISNCVLL